MENTNKNLKIADEEEKEEVNGETRNILLKAEDDRILPCCKPVNISGELENTEIEEFGNSETGELGENEREGEEIQNSKLQITNKSQISNDKFKKEERELDNLGSSEFGKENRKEGEEDGEGKEVEEIPGVKAYVVKNKLAALKKDIDELLNILESDDNLKEYEKRITEFSAGNREREANDDDAEEIIEGVFDGQKMVGNNGENYDVPANYASKSKLVEGDVLKLRILKGGRYNYKQIDKIVRNNEKGSLVYDEDKKQYYVDANGRKYKVLTASITYFKGEPGDEVIITLPEGRGAEWAAVEMVNR